MSKLVVEISSKNVIRPASPTPNHLKNLQFSFVDQIVRHTFMPFVFFYPSYRADYPQTIKLLKESLSKTLVQFYPFAGRVEDLYIDCNDEGVAFYEANVLSTLVQVTGNPNNCEELTCLVPFSFNRKGKEVAGIQVNRFLCGSLAIGFSISHKVADANTYLAFIDDFAKRMRGDSKISNAPEAKFVGASFFPQVKMDVADPRESNSANEKIVSKRLIFNKEMIEMLKKRCVGSADGKAPSGVGVVTAFLWKQFIRVARTKPTPIKICAVHQVVNMREVRSSPIPKKCYGNVFSYTLVSARVDTEMEYPEAVERLRDEVKRARSSSYYTEIMQTGKYVLEMKDTYEKIGKLGGDMSLVSDLTKFPFYEVDFGWGKPAWVSMNALPSKNVVFLMGTRCGEEIEAWMNMVEEDVAVFEQDPQFRSLTPPGSPSKL